jgi:hypothetical protein
MKRMKCLLVMTVSIGVLSIVGCGSSPTQPLSLPPSSDELVGTWIRSDGEIEVIFNPDGTDGTYIIRYFDLGGGVRGEWWLEGNKLTMTTYFSCIGSLDPIPFSSDSDRCSGALQGAGHITWPISISGNRLNIGWGSATEGSSGRRRETNYLGTFFLFQGTWLQADSLWQGAVTTDERIPITQVVKNICGGGRDVTLDGHVRISNRVSKVDKNGHVFVRSFTGSPEITGVDEEGGKYRSEFIPGQGNTDTFRANIGDTKTVEQTIKTIGPYRPKVLSVKIMFQVTITANGETNSTAHLSPSICYRNP